jgi:hypothetical protein
MKYLQKYSIYIYIIVPALAAIWPALVLAKYLPSAEKKLEKDITAYAKANNTMLDIISLSPERIESEDPNKEKIEFSYDSVVNEVASFCKIPSGKCKWNTGSIFDSKNSKTQTANVTLNKIDITSFSKFLSVIQSRWPKLVCNKVKLNKKPNIPDEWDINIDFKYYYTATD